MIIKYPENICVICGADIPEGNMICPKCGATEADMFEKPLIDDDKYQPLSKRARENSLKIKDEVEQAFRQGYKAGMTKIYELKADNARLQRENEVLRASLRTFGVETEDDEE